MEELIGGDKTLLLQSKIKEVVVVAGLLLQLQLLNLGY
jgi:hypothetical protein